MLIYILIINIMSIGVNLNKDKSILLYSRSFILSILTTIIIAKDSTYAIFLDKGITFFGGLFYLSYVNNMFNIFFLIVCLIIGLITSFYPRKVLVKEKSNIYNTNFSDFLYNKDKILVFTVMMLIILIGGIFLKSANSNFIFNLILVLILYFIILFYLENLYNIFFKKIIKSCFIIIITCILKTYVFEIYGLNVFIHYDTKISLFFYMFISILCYWVYHWSTDKKQLKTKFEWGDRYKNFYIVMIYRILLMYFIGLSFRWFFFIATNLFDIYSSGLIYSLFNIYLIIKLLIPHLEMSIFIRMSDSFDFNNNNKLKWPDFMYFDGGQPGQGGQRGQGGVRNQYRPFSPNRFNVPRSLESTALPSIPNRSNPLPDSMATRRLPPIRPDHQKIPERFAFNRPYWFVLGRNGVYSVIDPHGIGLRGYIDMNHPRDDVFPINQPFARNFSEAMRHHCILQNSIVVDWDPNKWDRNINNWFNQYMLRKYPDISPRDYKINPEIIYEIGNVD